MKILLFLALLVICQAKMFQSYEDLIRNYQQELELKDAIYKTFEGLKRAPFVPELQAKEEFDSKSFDKMKNALHDVFQALKQFPIVRTNYGSKIGIGNKEKMAKLVPEHDLLVTRLMYG